MSDAEAAPAPAPAAPVKKTPKKKSTAAKAKKTASHPKYSDMVKKAIAELKERGGSSRQAILKYIVRTYKVSSDSAKNPLKQTLRRGVSNGTLKQCKGTGASGSFKLGDKVEKKTKKPKAKKATKPKAAGAKPKTKKVKKPKAAGAKKSPKKAKKPKAKKPAGEKKVKAAKPKVAKKKTPKKAKKAAKPAAKK